MTVVDKYIESNQQCHAMLFAMAIDCLPIQASSVPCERVFTSEKKTVLPQRNHILGELMEQLQMLKYSIDRGHGLNFTQGLKEKDEIQELEAHWDTVHIVPEDIHSFTLHLRQGE